MLGLFLVDDLVFAVLGDILETLALIEQGSTRQVLEIPVRRGDRAVEGARLEIVCAPNKGTEGSNPSLSAKTFHD